MKVKISSIIIILIIQILSGIFLLILAGNLSSCTKDGTDPTKVILGKWELVLLTRNEGRDDIRFKPTGYVEYYPDSLMGWYDYKTKKYTLLEGKYWLDFHESKENSIWNHCILHYEQSVDYPDHFSGCLEYKCTFKSVNQMDLDQRCVDAVIGAHTYVYKRK